MAWLDGWEYCKKITIPSDSIDGELSNFPLTVYLNDSNFDFSKCKADGSDIRFTDIGLNNLKFERKEHNRPHATFDGSGDYFTTPSNTDFAFGTGDFCIESLINPPTYPTNAPMFVCEVNNGIWLGKLGSNFVIHPYNGTTLLTTATLPPVNTISHVAFIRSNGVLSIFIDGISVASVSSSFNFVGGQLNIGTDNRSANFWNGILYGTRITKGRARYTSNFTPPDYFEVDDTDVVLCTNFDTELSGGAFQDDTGKTLTAYGNATNVMSNAVYNVQLPTVSDTTDTEIYMWYGNENAYNASMEAWQDMTGKALTYGSPVKLEYNSTLNKRVANMGGTGYFDLDATSFKFGANDFCVEWIEYKTASSGAGCAFCSETWATGYCGILVGYSNTSLYMTSAVNSWNLVNNGQIGTLVLNTPVHRAIVRDGTNIKAYQDGVLTNTWAIGTASLYNPGVYPATINRYQATSKAFNGYIYGMRITKGSPRYTEGFTPPTTFDIDGDDVVFCTNFDTVYDEHYNLVQHMGDSLVDASGTIGVLINANTAVTTSDFGKVRSFNGSSSYLRKSGITNFQRSGSQPLSVLAFINPNWTSGYRDIVANRSASYYNWILYMHTTGGTVQLHGAAQNKSTFTPANSVWGVIYTKVNTSNIYTLFYDTILKQTVNGFAYQTQTPNELSIGNFGNAEYYNGLIGEIRVSLIDRSDAWIKAESLALKNNLLTITDFENSGGTLSLFFGMNF